MSVATLADATGVGIAQRNREQALSSTERMKKTPLVCFVVPMGAELPEQLKLTTMADLAEFGHIAYREATAGETRANMFVSFVSLDDLDVAIRNASSFRCQFRVMLGVPRLEYPAMFGQVTYNLPVITWNELVDKLELGENARFDASLPIAGGAELGKVLDEEVPIGDGDE